MAVEGKPLAIWRDIEEFNNLVAGGELGAVSDRDWSGSSERVGPDILPLRVLRPRKPLRSDRIRYRLRVRYTWYDPRHPPHAVGPDLDHIHAACPVSVGHE